MAATAFARATPITDPGTRLREMIREKSLLTGDSFQLSSGETSSYFFNMKMTMMDPEGANLIADVILARPEIASAAAIGGLVMGAVPIVSVVSARSFYTGRPIPGFFVRKDLKGHGTNKLIEGYLPQKGETVVCIDDVTTKGLSVMGAVKAARDAGCIVDVVITVVDRLEGAEENLRREGVELVALLTRDDF